MGAPALHLHGSLDVILSPIVVTAVVFAVYLPTVTKGIPGGDSGELVAEACQLGVAHPPGYPLFVYLARGAIALLPASLGSPAYRVNVLCAGLGASAAGLAAAAGARLASRVASSAPNAARAFASIAAAAWALSPLVWLYSIGAEVFALANFFLAALLFAFAAFCDAAASLEAPAQLRRRACALAFVCGLALTNQHTALLLIVPIAVFVAAVLARGLFYDDDAASGVGPQWARAGGRVAALLGAGAAGLVPYAHLPLAHALWRGKGSWGDASSAAGFLRHFLRGDYGTFKLYAREGASEGFRARTAAWAADVAHTQMPAGAALFAVAGAIAALWTLWSGGRGSGGADETSKGAEVFCTGDVCVRATPSPSRTMAACVARRAPAAVVVFLLFYIGVFHSLSNMPLRDPLLYAVHARFWMQPNLLLFVLAGVGCTAVFALGPRVSALSARPRVRGAIAALAVGAAGVGVASAAARARPALDHSQNDVLNRYGRALLEPLPRGALLVTSFDMQWTAARYVQTCERVRPDVILLNAPVAGYAWFAAQRRLYVSDGAAFPGSHLVSHLTEPHARGGFSLLDLIVANAPEGDCGASLLASYDADPPHDLFRGVVRDAVGVRECASFGAARGGVFFTGTLGAKASDKYLSLSFDVVPHGIVSTARLRAGGPISNVSSWRDFSAGAANAVPPASAALVAKTRRAWVAAVDQYDGTRVRLDFFGAETWERATRIDFFAQATAYATWLLDVALAERAGADADAFDVPAAIEAAAILERAAWAAGEHGEGPPSPATLKNLGLVYSRLVRFQKSLATEGGSPDDARGLPLLPSFRTRLNLTDDDVELPTWGLRAGRVTMAAWRAAAAERVLVTWGAFLETPDAATDPGRKTIAHVVSVLTAASTRKS
jgi:hypothetical protein